MMRINTLQFAILSKEPEESYDIQTGMELKYTIDGGAVAVNATFSFVHDGKTAMILKLLCEFAIHPTDLESLKSEDKITIPKNIVDYFIAQTVGTARGILHCKTEGTPFNGIIIPPMNVTGLFNGDLVINLQKESQK